MISYPKTIVIIKKISVIHFMSISLFTIAFNGLSTKAGFFSLFLNSASSYFLRDKQRIFIWISNVVRRFFISLNVVTESEEEEEIPSSIMPIWYDLIFFIYHFEILQVNNDHWYRILQWEQPHKNSEDTNKDRGFLDPNYQNISQQKYSGV